MSYENGMSVSYEEVSRTLTIFFRGKLKEIKMPATTTQAEARKAGEEYCRSLGWNE